MKKFNIGKRNKKEYKSRFDWEGFKIFSVTGIIFTALGYFISWAIYTKPKDSEPTEILAFRPLLRFTREIPQQITEKVAYGLAILFILFGLFMFFMALFRLLVFVFKKTRHP